MRHVDDTDAGARDLSNDGEETVYLPFRKCSRGLVENENGAREPQRLGDRQLLPRIFGAVGLLKTEGAAEMGQSGGEILALAQELASAGVDQDRIPLRRLHEIDAGRQVGDEHLQHVGHLAKVL